MCDPISLRGRVRRRRGRTGAAFIRYRILCAGTGLLDRRRGKKNPSGLEIQEPARPVGRGKAEGRAGEAKPSSQSTMFGDKFLRK